MVFFLIIRILQKLCVCHNDRQGRFQLMGRVGNKTALLFPGQFHRLYCPACQQKADSEKNKETEQANDDTVPAQIAQSRLFTGNVRVDKDLADRGVQAVIAEMIFFYDAGTGGIGTGVVDQGGLDPIQIIEIRDLIRQLGQERTVILSSHILSEVRTICEKVLIIAKGKLVAFDTPENLEKLLLASRGVSFVAEAEMDEIDEILNGMKTVSNWQMKALEDGSTQVDVQLASGEASDLCRSLFFAFAGKKKALLELTSKKANLEDVFIELTESDIPGAGPAEKEAEKSESEKSESKESESKESESEESEVADK